MVILHKKELDAIKDFVAKYYPKGGVRVEIETHSEYNEEAYDNYLQYIVVYDKDGKEIQPVNGKEVRGRMRGLGKSFIPYETNECLPDFEVNL